jgi:hypothetical protein
VTLGLVGAAAVTFTQPLSRAEGLVLAEAVSVTVPVDDVAPTWKLTLTVLVAPLATVTALGPLQLVAVPVQVVVRVYVVVPASTFRTGKSWVAFVFSRTTTAGPSGVTIGGAAALVIAKLPASEEEALDAAKVSVPLVAPVPGVKFTTTPVDTPASSVTEAGDTPPHVSFPVVEQVKV